MKLKKIVSLAAAAIMAVSMLTACDSAPITETPNDDMGTTTPTVTGYSAKLADEIADLSVIAGKKVEWSESSDLQSSLNYQVGNVGYNALTESFLRSLSDGRVQFVDAFWATPAIVTTVSDNVADDMGANVVSRNSISASAAVLALNPTLTNYATDDYNTVMLFVVDNGVDLNNAMDQIAALIDGGIVNLDDDFSSTALPTTSMNVDYEYTGSVATCTKTFETGHGVGVSFIAVEIVRHIA